MTPGAYGRGGKGMRIGYTIVDCPIGRLLVAATQKGVSAVSIGESDEVLETELSREYPNAEIRRDDGGLGDHIAALLRYFQGKEPHLALGLDVRITAFQEKVYEALRAIPYGGSRTYSEIAEAIGSPRAARAVGHACATNPTSIIVPCHRVVRKDGDLGGYRWGLERKEELRARERELRHKDHFEKGAGI
jgi:AraC family transcriptional regulator of adaptative response/methylated-DNA-[protein]-cysteine methyltransferase